MLKIDSDFRSRLVDLTSDPFDFGSKPSVWRFNLHWTELELNFEDFWIIQVRGGFGPIHLQNFKKKLPESALNQRFQLTIWGFQARPESLIPPVKVSVPILKPRLRFHSVFGATIPVRTGSWSPLLASIWDFVGKIF